MVKFDYQKLIECTGAAGCRDTLRYEYKRSHAEALLAVPDAIAWCWAKGGPLAHSYWPGRHGHPRDV